MRTFRSLLASTFLPLALPVALVGCGDDDTGPDPEPGAARLRVVHASPDAPAVDVYVQGSATPILSDLAYGEVSPYLEVDAATYTLELRAAGQVGGAAAYTTGPLALGEDQTVTAVATGFLASSAEADRFRILPLVEGFTMPGSGQVTARIVHASADAPTVGIDVGADDPTAPEVAALERFADTGAAGVALPAGQALRVGIAAGGATVTSFTTPSLPAGAELFVIAVGRLGDLPRQATGFSLMAVGPAGLVGTIAQDPTVFALHASPDAPAVDIREANSDALLIDNLAFGQLERVQVPPGDYTLDFYGAGSPAGTPAASAPVAGLAAGQRYLAVATGFLSPVGGEPSFRLIAAVDEFALDAGNARIGAIHASPDAPAVDVAPVTGLVMSTPRLIEDFAFEAVAAGEGLVVPPTTLDLGIAPANAANALVAFRLTTTAGLRAFAVAMGALSPVGQEEPFGLTVVDTSVWPWTATPLVANN